MRVFALMPKGVDLTPCKYCANPIAELHEYQCLHDMGSEYAPCKQLERMARQRRGRRAEIICVMMCASIAICVMFLIHNW